MNYVVFIVFRSVIADLEVLNHYCESSLFCQLLIVKDNMDCTRSVQGPASPMSRL